MSPTANKDQIQERLTETLAGFGADKDAITRDATWEELDATRSTSWSSLRSSRTNTGCR